MSFIDTLLDLAMRSGCTDRAGCEKTLNRAAQRQSSLIDALLDDKLVEESAFLEGLAAALGMEWQLRPELDLSEPLHNKFPASVAMRYRVAPSRLDATEVRLLTYDPLNLIARQAVAQAVPRTVRWAMSTRRNILEALKQGYGVGAENFEKILESHDIEQQLADLKQEVTVLDEADEDASVMSFVNQIFREALRERATDIHVEPLENDLRIRYRIDGALQEVTIPPNIRLLQASLVSRLKIMAHLDIAERRLPQDGRINLELDGQPIDVRVATIPSVAGESVSLRLLSQDRFDFEQLGLDPHTESVVRDLLAKPNGIVLLTGPTGSGKSTTLYTFLKSLNTKHRRIVTIEDPVEYKLPGVVQIAVKPEIELTFATGLRSILRGDPNVIMVGEMRDLETAEIAIRGALTGHLVFSTLHTNNAVGGIMRLIDMGIEPFLIASAVRAFIAQRLVRVLCPHCKSPAEFGDDYLHSIGFPLELKGGIKQAVGCRECRQTGYTGRAAILEICRVTPHLQELVSQRAQSSELREAAIHDGMVPLRRYGFQKVSEGMTTIEEVLTRTDAEPAMKSTGDQLSAQVST